MGAELDELIHSMRPGIELPTKSVSERAKEEKQKAGQKATTAEEEPGSSVKTETAASAPEPEPKPDAGTEPDPDPETEQGTNTEADSEKPSA